jgi:three-Cys-motif partner protein
VIDGDGLPARCVGPWSDDKLFYMRRYADIFVKGMKNKWENLVYADLFAGPGKCRMKPRGNSCEGSPLIALQLPFTHYYFNDLSAEVTTALDNRIRVAARPGVATRIWTGDANVNAAAIRSQIAALGRETLTFAFIDPPGIEFRFDSLRAFTAGLPIDLLIYFPLGQNIKRQVRHRLASTKQDDPFDTYFGTEAWRDACERRSGEIPFGPKLLDLYKEQVRTLGYQCVGNVMPVVKDGERALYVLIFASKHKVGEEFWAKIAQKEPSGQGRLL